MPNSQNYDTNGKEEAERPLMQPGEKIEPGAACDYTLRIVVVSPYPAALQDLVLELTARCFDVLVFHEEDEALLSVLQGDLYILDRTGPDPQEFVDSTYHSRGELLSLVDPGTEQKQWSKLTNQAVIAWPSPVDEVLDAIAEITRDKVPAAFFDPHRLVLKDLTLDLKKMTVKRGDSFIDLTKTEYILLKVLIRAEGKVLSRDDIMREVWEDEYFGGSNYVDVHVRSLRRKLGDDVHQPTYIATVRGVGYRAMVDEIPAS